MAILWLMSVSEKFMAKEHFVKTNSRHLEGLFVCEKRGLELLKKGYPDGHGLRVPQVFVANEECIEMEMVTVKPATAKYWSALGVGLGQLHKIVGKYFGLDYDNYIGNNRQKNEKYDNWAEFFWKFRLQFQLDLMSDTAAKQRVCQSLKGLENKAKELLNSHSPAPSLVHGDLWSGNVLCGEGDVPWIIDPAIYYGDREVDLAMSELFGGFSTQFYQSYNREFPLDGEYAKRRPLYNLYHALNHLNLFGDSYFSMVFQLLEEVERETQ